MKIASLNTSSELTIHNGEIMEIEAVGFPISLIGNRNLLLESDEVTVTSDYVIKHYALSQEINNGETVTISIEGTLGGGKSNFGFYNTSGTINLVEMYPSDVHNGVWIKTFNWKTISPNVLRVYHMPHTVSTVSTISKIKLEKGNSYTPWTPAPEDLGLDFPEERQSFTPSEYNTIKFSDSGIGAFDFIEANGFSLSNQTVTATEFIEISE